MVDHSPNPGEAPGGERSGRPPRVGDFFWLGTGCAICVVGGGAIGYGLDSAFGTTPWVTFGGLAFGVVSAVLLAVAQVRKFLP